MILAALTLLAIGGADVARRALPGRGAALLVPAALVLAVAIAAGAWWAGPVALVLAAGWIVSMPADRPARGGMWPAVAVAAIVVALVVLLPARIDAAWLGGWEVEWPGGSLAFDAALLAIGALVFLIESSNLVVRACLAADSATDERAPAPAAPGEPDPGEMYGVDFLPDRQPAATPQQVMRGGRLIGPLERIIVFALTLAAAYPLLAAFIAAKGIVRFPEISRDDDLGNRAEYFLVGSLVSWVQALAAAFAVWWATA